MEEILASRNRLVLEQFAWSNVLVGFDFDGTLSPIVPERASANMRPTTAESAARLAELYPCAIISGRAYDDLTRLTAELPSWTVWSAGEACGPDRQVEARGEVRRWLSLLEPQIDPAWGIELEDKGTRVSLHYRRSRARRRAPERIAEMLRPLRGARVIHSKQVVHLLPACEPHKGIALDELRRRSECDTAIYVGDDETDEDVFGSETETPVLTIRIGRSRRSQAQYFLHDQSHVDPLMRTLAEIRERRGKRREVR